MRITFTEALGSILYRTNSITPLLIEQNCIVKFQQQNNKLLSVLLFKIFKYNIKGILPDFNNLGER